MLEKKPNYENVRTRVFDVSLRIMKLCNSLPRSESNLVITRQVLRSCTSVGANLEEAAGSITKNEFIYSMNISKKEARETHYWLRLIHESNNMIIKKRMEELLIEAEEIIKILTSSVKTARTVNRPSS